MPRLHQLVTEPGEADDDRAHAEHGADNEINKPNRRRANNDVDERERCRNLTHEENGKSAVTVQRVCDPGDTIAKQSLNSPQAYPPAD